MIRGNRRAEFVRNHLESTFWGYLPLENNDDGSLESDIIYLNLKNKKMKRVHNIGVGGQPVTIDWQQGEVIDRHDSGCADVQLSGTDDEGVNYEAVGVTQDGELVDVIEDTIQGDLE